jgi:hypothetical protein
MSAGEKGRKNVIYMYSIYRMSIKFLFNILRAEVKNVIPHMKENIFLIAAERCLLGCDTDRCMLFVLTALISKQ